MRSIHKSAIVSALLIHASGIRAEPATPGYPEPILQWTVQPGETCRAIAEALYGNARHALVVGRYESVDCTKPLAEGRTLVVPATITDLPTARLRGLHPEVRERPAGGAWNRAAPGMSLFQNHSVNTLDDARADILFSDRTRVYLAEHTLVVIYGSAASTRVTKTRPVHVELDEGEVQAGLAALRGDSARVGVRGGAEVSARSRDTVVRKKKVRSTVSVFDGDAAVSSGGKLQAVQERFGTSFVERAAPTLPRPLPPAPNWSGATTPVVLVPVEGGTILASWSAIPDAATYRIELARDADFTDLLLRQEVPGTVLSFRAEHMPAGSYFLRVRGIDHEDFLGIASTNRAITLVASNLAAVALGPNTLELHPYAELVLAPMPGLELSIDSGPFFPVPKTLDVERLRPTRLALRGGVTDQPVEYRVSYRRVAAHIETATEPNDGALRVVVELEGFDGVDVALRVKPRLRVSVSGQQLEAALLPDSRSRVLAARVVPPSGEGPVRFDVLDSRDRVLGSSVLDRPHSVEPGPPKREPGVTAPPIAPSLATDVAWWSPGSDRTAALSVVAGAEDSEARAQVHARASTGLDDFAVDVRLASGDLAKKGAADDAAWLGFRWRAATAGDIELGPSARASIPTDEDGSPARGELGFAVGARYAGWSWLANAGGRGLVRESNQTAPDGQGFFLAGASVNAADWVSAYGLLDAHGLVRGDVVDPRGGFTLGLELDTPLFAGASVRVSPWDEDGGHASGQLAFGLREVLPP